MTTTCPPRETLLTDLENESNTRATIPVTDQQLLTKIFGMGDSHLRQLHNRLPVQVTIRQGQITIDGSTQDVESAVEIIQEWIRLSTAKEPASETEYRNILDRHAHTPGVPNEKHVVFEGKRKVIRAKTAGQSNYIQQIVSNDLVFCAGPAGSGKTYLAVAAALQALQKEQVRKIVLVRPAVEAGEKLGYLPGDMLAKVNPFLRPLLDALQDMIENEAVQTYMENDVIEIVPLAFMRGRTLNDTFIILDEAQNATITQMKMFLTRMGNGSKIVITGDITQKDLPENVESGLADAVRRLKEIKGIGVVHLQGEDIVRHRLVKSIVKAYEQDEREKRTRS